MGDLRRERKAMKIHPLAHDVVVAVIAAAVVGLLLLRRSVECCNLLWLHFAVAADFHSKHCCIRNYSNFHHPLPFYSRNHADYPKRHLFPFVARLAEWMNEYAHEK